MVTFLTVLASLAAILTYWHQYVKGPEEARQHLVFRFNYVHQRNSDLLRELRGYTAEHGADHDEFMRGYDFQESIAILERYEREVFTAENLNVLQTAPANVLARTTEDMIKRIDVHDLFVTQAREYFRRVFQQAPPS